MTSFISAVPKKVRVVMSDSDISQYSITFLLFAQLGLMLDKYYCFSDLSGLFQMKLGVKDGLLLKQKSKRPLIVSFLEHVHKV